MLNNMVYTSLYNTKINYITKTDGTYHTIRKEVYNKNICYITCILSDILNNIYDNMLCNIYVIIWCVTYMLYNIYVT